MDHETYEAKNKELLITAETVLFFDLDGTLCETNIANFLSYKKAIQYVTGSDQGLTHNPEKRFNRSVLKNVLPNLNETEYEKIIQKKEEVYNDFFFEIKLNTKIVDILNRYAESNKVVLVTNCRKERALAILNHFGLTNKFSNIFFRQLGNKDNKINKFQNAILELAIPPKFIIAFENEDIEIADAKEAGIKIINPSIT